MVLSNGVQPCDPVNLTGGRFVLVGGVCVDGLDSAAGLVRDTGVLLNSWVAVPILVPVRMKWRNVTANEVNRSVPC